MTAGRAAPLLRTPLAIKALLDVFEDLRECDHDASGRVLEGSSNQGARLCGGSAGRRIVAKVQVQQPIRRRRTGVFFRPDPGGLQPGEAGEIPRQRNVWLDLVAECQAGSGVAGVGGVELAAEGGNSAGAAGRG